MVTLWHGMNYAQRVNDALLLIPDFSLILCGYLLCRYTALNRSVWQPIETVVYFFLFPVLLFQSIVRTPLDLSTASPLMGAGVGLGITGIAIALSLPHWPVLGRHIDRHEHAGAAQVGFRFNSFIALTVCERLMGGQGLALVAVLIGVCVPMFNVAAVWPMARHRRLGLARELARNPLILATASGLLFNLAGFQIPEWLAPTVQRIGASSLALGLMAAGAGLQLHSLQRGQLLGVSLLLNRHLVFPLLALGWAALMRLDADQRTVLLVFSAMPTASTCYVLAARMGYNGPYVAALVTLSTLAGMLSLPLALALTRW
ncbi:MAG: hypothetical protein RIQ38_1945 [Pseudomonadota bacterium]